MSCKKRGDFRRSGFPAIILALAFGFCFWMGGEKSALAAFILYAAGAVCMGLCVQITVKYLASSVIYLLESDSLRIYRVCGKESTLLANIPLYTCTALEKRPSVFSKSENLKENSRVYNYACNLFPKDARMLIFRTAGVCEAVIIEADEDFYRRLLTLMPSKRV